MKIIMLFIAMAVSLASCSDKIEIQQVYDYALDIMPVQNTIMQGETAEIRCKLVKSGNYDGAQFTIRYFQIDGDGDLRLDDGTVFKPNDTYPLTKDVFRLYYTSHCTEAQHIDVYIEDNFNQEQKYTFEFTNKNEEL